METFLNLFASPGPLHLFFLSFLAATLLPIGSEWLLVLLLVQGQEPARLVCIATVGNFLGACTTYLVGIWGSNFLVRRIFGIDDRQLARASRLFQRYGVWSLLFSWLPVLGDPLCLLAGLLHVGPLRFAILVFVGKLFRYTTVALLLHTTTGP